MLSGTQLSPWVETALTALWPVNICTSSPFFQKLLFTCFCQVIFSTAQWNNKHPELCFPPAVSQPDRRLILSLSLSLSLVLLSNSIALEDSERRYKEWTICITSPNCTNSVSYRQTSTYQWVTEVLHPWSQTLSLQVYCSLLSSDS